MKTLPALSGLLLSLFLLSCSREEPASEPEIPSGFHVETLTAEFPSGTRTAFDETTGRFSWTEGDKLAFHLSDGTYQTSSVDPETGRVRLVLPDGTERNHFAVCQADIAVDEHAEPGDLMIRLPGSYDLTGRLRSDDVPLPLVADNDPSCRIIRFNHVGGLLQIRLRVPPGTKTARVSLGRRITGLFSVSPERDGCYKIAAGEPADRDTLNFLLSENGLDATEEVWLPVPVPTGSYDELLILLGNGRTDTDRFRKDVSFNFVRAAGKKVTISDASITDERDYLWFEAVTAGSSVRPVLTLGMTVTDKTTHPLFYSYDKREWTPYDYDEGRAIPLASVGERVYFRGARNFVQNYMNPMEYDYLRFDGRGKLNVGGDILSLLDQVHPEMINDARENCGPFRGLFMNNRSLIDASELHLPDYTVPMCFWSLFEGCSSLTTAPLLPSTMVTRSCYNSMFADCSSLLEAPDLPAVRMADACYMRMFCSCSTLTDPPALPATELAPSCYNNMFAYCRQLTHAPALPATTLSYGSYQEMFNYCYALREAPELPATELAERCYYQMFGRCRALREAPALPATRMAKSCYWNMFFGCQELTVVPALPAMELAEGCYYQMFCECKKITAAPELPATILIKDCYKYMFRDCSSLSRMTVLFPTWPGTVSSSPDYGATAGWLDNVPSTGTFIKVAALDTEYGPGRIPNGWAVSHLVEIEASL